MRLFLRLLAQLVVVSVVAVAGSMSVSAAHGNTPLTLVLGVATAVLSLFAYAWVVRRTERRDGIGEWSHCGSGDLSPYIYGSLS